MLSGQAFLRLCDLAAIEICGFLTASQYTGRFERWIEDRGLRRAHAVFAPSQYVADYVSGKLGREVKVIESPFVAPTFKADESALHSVWDGESPFGLYFGSLSQWKGVFVLAEALRQFLAEHPHLQFVWVGNDLSHRQGVPASQWIANHLSEFAARVHYFPALPHAQLYPILRRAKFVALPSLADNLPNACLESMAMGRVVIGTIGRSLDQLITDGKSGLLCQPGSRQDLVRCLSAAAALSDIERERIGREAIRAVATRSPSVLGPQLIEFYQQTLQKSGAAACA